MAESALEQAERHVREGEEHVARQTALLAKLEQDGHEREAAEARALLGPVRAWIRLPFSGDDGRDWQSSFHGCGVGGLGTAD